MSTKTNDSAVLYEDNTNNPTNVDTTMQASITKDAEGNILEQFQDSQNDKQYASTPKTETSPKNSASGDGLSAADGVKYSWETNSSERAALDYKSAVLESKSNYLTNRQELETQGQTYQEQIDMQKYAQNQSNEKAGWTGGYILDTERQMEYLKQGIQSQMYGAMELQRYGYDTSLAAARLAYDTNKYDLALEYYNTALSRAVTQAELTGYYIAPEVSEHLNQYSIASTILNSDTSTEDEKLRAEKILDSVYKWFESNGISKQGAMTITQRQWIKSLDDQYDYLDDDQTQISTDTFVKVDSFGEKIYGAMDVEKINFSTMSIDDIMDYIYSGPQDSEGNTTINTIAKNQYLSRLDSITYETSNNFTSWCKNQGHLDAEGNVTSNESLSELFTQYIQNSNITTKLEEEISKLEGADSAKLQELINEWECTIDFPDGTVKTVTLIPSSGTSKEDSSIKSDSSLNLNISDAEIKDSVVTKSDGTVVMKDQKSSAQIMRLLNSEEYATFYNSIMDGTLDLSTNETFAETFETWAARIVGGVGAGLGGLVGAAFWGPIGAAVGVAVGGFAGNFTGEAVGQIVSLVSDVFTSGKYKEQLKVLGAIKDSWKNVLGEANVNLLKADYDRYNNLTDRDRALLKPAELENLKKVHDFYDRIAAIERAIDYADDRDSDMFTDPWDYIGDSWKLSISNWDDGYQLGDVTRTVVKGLGAAVKTVGSVIVGGFKWIFGIKNG